MVQRHVAVRQSQSPGETFRPGVRRVLDSRRK